jgi:hypothetical protein
MDTPLSARTADVGLARDVPAAIESAVSAVSWAAVLAGAVVAAAASIILLSLGSGLGLASLSPWSTDNPSVTTFTVMTAIWLIVVQWVASGLGGYMTGRLRTKWVDLHSQEVFFRDTAHGFLAWAVATLLTAAIITSASTAMVGSGVRAASTVAGGAAQGATTAATGAAATRAYDVDSLFRSAKTDDGSGPMDDTRTEASRILAMGVTNGDVPAADRTYLAQLIAARTGISEADAQKRVDDVVAQEKAAEAKMRDAADKARKAASAFSIFTALSMVIGAFIASVAAAFGGRSRDEHA